MSPFGDIEPIGGQGASGRIGAAEPVVKYYRWPGAGPILPYALTARSARFAFNAALYLPADPFIRHASPSIRRLGHAARRFNIALSQNGSTGRAMLSFERSAMSGSRGMAGHGHDAPHLLVVVDGDVDEREGLRTHEMRCGSFRVSGANVAHDLWFGSSGANCLIVEAGGTFWTRVFKRRVGGAALGAFGSTNAAAALSEINSAEMLTRTPSVLRAFGRLMATFGHGDDEAPSWIEDAVHHVEADKTRSLACMAATLSRDRVHLARTFGAWLGFRPVEYRALRRAAAAVQLIKTSHVPLAELALACGYTHQSHMNRSLKDLFGHTPAYWRS